MAQLDHEAFKKQWKDAGEDTSDVILDVAWRRYQFVNSPDYDRIPENAHPNLEQLQSAYDPLLNRPEIAALWSQRIYLTLRADNIPWLPTGIVVSDEQPISIFATGRTWRSKLLDLYLTPQFNLWYKIGVNGDIFNSTHDTKTFNATNGQSGELFVAHQFPGAFHDKVGGRVGGELSVYDRAEGIFNILIIQWNFGTGIYPHVRPAIKRLLDLSQEGHSNEQLLESNPYHLLSTSVERMSSDYFSKRFPADWKFLWFLGMSEIFFQETVEEPEIEITEGNSEIVKDIPSSDKVIRCLPNKNVGILQKDLDPPLLLSSLSTVSWTWKFIDLPSRLREDTSLSHDYLSLAFEFENGRDLTYTWSWELPIGFGYWCPLAAWCDREYHIVVRSGTTELGQWLDERRNLRQDYVDYVNDGDTSKLVPQQVVRVWLIAGNRWQRHRGEMLIKDIRLLKTRTEEFEPSEDASGTTIVL